MNELYDSPIWDKKSNKKMWELYLGDSHYVSPGELDDVSYFPKTYVEVCEFDCLKDEGILFANKLKSCGVDVNLNETNGTNIKFIIILSIFILKLFSSSFKISVSSLKSFVYISVVTFIFKTSLYFEVRSFSNKSIRQSVLAHRFTAKFCRTNVNTI